MRRWRLTWSPDGEQLLVGFEATNPGGPPPWFQAFATATGQPLGEPLRQPSGLSQAGFTPDGAGLLTVGVDGHARLWDAASRAPRSPFLKGPDKAGDLRWSPQGQRFLFGGGLWDRQGTLVAPLLAWRAGKEPRFTPDGTKLILEDSWPGLAPALGRWPEPGHAAEPQPRNGFTPVDLRPASGPVADLRRLAQRLAGRRVDGTGALVPLAVGEAVGGTDTPKQPTEAEWHRQELAREPAASSPAALFHVEHLLRLEPRNPALHAWRGWRCWGQNQLDQAEAAFTQALAEGATGADVWFGRGLTYFYRRRYDAATADFDQLLTRFPREEHGWYGRSQAHAERERWPEAIADLERLLALRASTPWDAFGDEGELWYELAMAQLAAGRLPEYRRVCQRLNQRANRYGTLQAWTWVLGPEGLADLADVDPRDANPLAQLVAEEPAELRTLGALRYRLGRYDAAQERLTRAVAKQEEFPTAWLFLAMTEHQRGQTQAAQAWLAKADQWLAEEASKWDWTTRAVVCRLRQEAEQVLADPRKRGNGKDP